MPPSPDRPGGDVAALGEFALIERLRRLVPAAGPGVRVGIGDDTAVLSVSGQLLATCDIQVEDVHFDRQVSAPADIGWRALAVNLSDIAAMGGTPRYALVSLALPPDTPIEMVEGIYRGLAEAAAASGTAVVGGNVSRTSGPLIIDVTALGEAQTVLRRDGAQPGDGVWVTGAVGKAAAGLFLLRHPQARAAGAGERLVAAYRRPTPRVAAGQALAASGVVTAVIDTSDGTASDLLRLVEASGVGVRLDLARLPLADGLIEVARTAGVDPAAWGLGGGEDYELLFTAGPAFSALAPALVQATGVPMTKIGEILPLAEGRWIAGPRSRDPLVAAGWDHFGHRG